jgi:predicted dehydrogenase
MNIPRRRFLQIVPTLALIDPLLRKAFAAKHDKIRAAQIGTKHAHASGKIGTMRKFNELYDVVAVVEPDDTRWNAVKDSAPYKGVSRVTEKELLSDNALQLVCVETEVRDLLATAERCVKAGKHIHLDKPAGEDLQHFARILDLTTEKKLTVQMGYMYRYNPGFQFLFRAIRSGWLGEIFEVHTVMSKKVNDATRRNLAEYPGGTMFELGCHIIDALITAIGPPDKVTPYTRRTRKDDPLADNQLAVFEYPAATATVRSTVVEVDGGRRRQFVACGTKGTIEILPLEPPALTMTLDQAQGDFKAGRHTVELPKLGGRYDGDFLDLAQVLHGEKESDFPPKHDLAVQTAVLQASGL